MPNARLQVLRAVRRGEVNPPAAAQASLETIRSALLDIDSYSGLVIQHVNRAGATAIKRELADLSKTPVYNVCLDNWLEDSSKEAVRDKVLADVKAIPGAYTLHIHMDPAWALVAATFVVRIRAARSDVKIVLSVEGKPNAAAALEQVGVYRCRAAQLGPRQRWP